MFSNATFPGGSVVELILFDASDLFHYSPKITVADAFVINTPNATEYGAPISITWSGGVVNCVNPDDVNIEAHENF